MGLSLDTERGIAHFPTVLSGEWGLVNKQDVLPDQEIVATAQQGFNIIGESNGQRFVTHGIVPKEQVLIKIPQIQTDTTS